MLYMLLLAAVSVERLTELAISQRHAAQAFALGGVEYGQRHFRVMQLLHTAFLLACALEVWSLQRPFLPWLGWPMLGLVCGAQGLRYWAIAALGPAWNTRVIVVPGERSVKRGPYRFLRHPNYVAVVIEGVALPLVHTAWIAALVFSVANLFLLTVRIRCEEDALVRHSDWANRFGTTPRFLPMRIKEPRR
jgi:methyltransferase